MRKKLLEDILTQEEEGDMCGINGCKGIIELSKPINCCCFNGCAPCSSCTNTYLFCNKCGERIENE